MWLPVYKIKLKVLKMENEGANVRQRTDTELSIFTKKYAIRMYIY